MNNQEIAQAFREIARLLQIKGENPFKIRAYERAVDVFNALPEEAAEIAREGRLEEVPGVGEAISDKVTELLETGRLDYLDRLRAEFPAGVTRLLDVAGVGPKTAARLVKEFGVGTPEELEAAIAADRFKRASGIGDKLIQRWTRHFERRQEIGGRIPLGVALPVALTVVEALQAVPGVRNLTPAGSLRRLEETVGDIDIIGSADRPEAVTDAFVHLPQVREVLWHGPQKASVRWESGVQVDLRILDHESFGALLHHFTGNRQHNIDLREYAVQRGWSISEYGLTNLKTGERVRIADEADLYARLGLAYIPPELRQGAGEIELAARGEIPTLVTEADLKGDLHAHTDWSDGADTIEAMARAAQALGRQYLAISDHSGGLGVAHGLSRERLEQQIRIVREVEQRVGGIRLLTASEVDIRADGSLDFPDDLLAQLDWVVASVHSSFEQSRDVATARVIRAIEHPAVTVIGHPSSRLIGHRDPIDLDYEDVFAAAKRTGTALEINSGPERLDLRDHHVRRARDLGVPLVVSTDAHATGNLAWIRFGVGVARRGWCRPEDIVNTRPVGDFLDWIRHTRSRRVA